MAANRASEAPRPPQVGLLTEYREILTRIGQLAAQLEARVVSLQDVSAPAKRETPPALDTASAPIELQMLGSFRLFVDGDEVELPSGGRGTALIKLLAHREGRAASRDWLIERLWPGAEPEAAGNRLRVVVHGLRRLTPELHDAVRHDSGSYRLEPGTVEVDADRFAALVARGLEYDAAGDRGHAEEAYRRAKALYRGDYLAGDPFEEWALVPRLRYRDMYLTLLVRLAEFALDDGDLPEVVANASAVLAADDCSEEAYRLLMLAHYREGNRARALRWYELCEATLEREFGMRPTEETRTLRTQIVSDDQALLEHRSCVLPAARRSAS